MKTAQKKVEKMAKLCNLDELTRQSLKEFVAGLYEINFSSKNQKGQPTSTLPPYNFETSTNNLGLYEV